MGLLIQKLFREICLKTFWFDTILVNELLLDNRRV